MKKYGTFSLIILSLLLLSCNNTNEDLNQKEFENKMNNIAENYVKLVLKIGQHDADYVDAYYGPEEWKPEEKDQVASDSAAIQKLYDEAGFLLDSLDSLSDYKADELETLRYKYLYKQILSARAKIFMLAGGEFSFDEEAKALYDAEPPHYSEEHFQKILDEIDTLLPGNNPLAERINSFKEQFVIPADRLDTVFQTAIRECRKRTLEHIKLPPEEKFTVEYVTNKPYGGYNWYKGGSYSVIEVNTDLPIYINRAVNLAAHEGYPGHHVYNLLLEKNLFRKRGWVEFSVYALNSPQSLIAEGTANYGIDVAFPGDSRIKFEKEVLFPLAGFDENNAEKFYKINDLTAELTYSGNEAARNYLDKKWNKEETIDFLRKYSLRTKESAEKFLQFIEKYRSYVINYNLGKDIVEKYIEDNGGTADHPDIRWKLFERLLSTPQTPSNLK